MVIPDTAELGKVWALMDLIVFNVARGTEYFGGSKGCRCLHADGLGTGTSRNSTQLVRAHAHTCAVTGLTPTTVHPQQKKR